MAEIINQSIDGLMKGDEINLELLDDLFVIIRHKF